MMQGAAAAHPTSELIGRWRGTSICTKADWNAACHDEEALYDFKEGVAPGHVLSKGYKIVNGTPEFMGDLDFAWDPGAGAWVAEFAGHAFARAGCSRCTATRSTGARCFCLQRGTHAWFTYGARP